MDWAKALAGQATTPQHLTPKHTVTAMTERVKPFLPKQMDRMSGFSRLRAYYLVYRLAYNGDVAAGQLAVFQGASEAPISESIRAERATRKNSQLAAARRVALKMGRRPRCSPVTYRSRYAPSSRLAGGPF